MATIRDAPHEVDFLIWYAPEFPIDLPRPLRTRNDQSHPWMAGLLEDIAANGLLNPIIVWGHHPYRGEFEHLPLWMLRIGHNRRWACQELGWRTIPTLVSTRRGETPPNGGIRVQPTDLKAYLPHGTPWSNSQGFFVQGAPRPEVEYAVDSVLRLDRGQIRP